MSYHSVLQLNTKSILEGNITPDKVWVIEVFLSEEEGIVVEGNRKDLSEYNSAYNSLDANPQLASSALFWRFQPSSSRLRTRGQWRRKIHSRQQKSPSPIASPEKKKPEDSAGSPAKKQASDLQAPVASSTPVSQPQLKTKSRSPSIRSEDAIALSPGLNSVAYSPRNRSKVKQAHHSERLVESIKEESPTSSHSTASGSESRASKVDIYSNDINSIPSSSSGSSHSHVSQPPRLPLSDDSGITNAQSNQALRRCLESDVDTQDSRPSTGSSDSFATPSPTLPSDIAAATTQRKTSGGVGLLSLSTDLDASSSFRTACGSFGGGDEPEISSKQSTLTREESASGEESSVMQDALSSPQHSSGVTQTQGSLFTFASPPTSLPTVGKTDTLPGPLRNWKFKSQPVADSEDDSDFVSSTELEQMLQQSKLAKPKRPSPTQGESPPEETKSQEECDHAPVGDHTGPEAEAGAEKESVLHQGVSQVKRHGIPPPGGDVDDDRDFITSTELRQILIETNLTNLGSGATAAQVEPKGDVNSTRVPLPNGVAVVEGEKDENERLDNSGELPEKADVTGENVAPSHGSSVPDHTTTAAALHNGLSESAEETGSKQRTKGDVTKEESENGHSSENGYLYAEAVSNGVSGSSEEESSKEVLRESSERERGNSLLSSGKTLVSEEQVEIGSTKEGEQWVEKHEEESNSDGQGSRESDVDLRNIHLEVDDSLIGGMVTPVELTLNVSTVKEARAKLNDSGEYSSLPEEEEEKGKEESVSDDDSSERKSRRSSAETISTLGHGSTLRPRAGSWFHQTLERQSQVGVSKLERKCLYVQQYMNTVVALVADTGLHQDHNVLNELWQSLLPQLMDLEGGLRRGEEGEGEGETTSKPLQSNHIAVYSATDRSCEAQPVTAAYHFRHALRRAHLEYMNDPSLAQIGLNKEHCRMLSQHVMDREIYFQPGRLGHVDALSVHAAVEKYARFSHRSWQQPAGRPKILFI